MTVPLLRCSPNVTLDNRTWQNACTLLVERGLAQFKRDCRLVEGEKTIQALRSTKGLSSGTSWRERPVTISSDDFTRVVNFKDPYKELQNPNERTLEVYREMFD
jgi:hypothetical protein